MKTLLIMAILVVFIISMAGLTTCAKPLTNEQIIEAHKLCTSAGMRTAVFSNFFYKAIRVECRPIRVLEKS